MNRNPLHKHNQSIYLSIHLSNLIFQRLVQNVDRERDPRHIHMIAMKVTYIIFLDPIVYCAMLHTMLYCCWGWSQCTMQVIVEASGSIVPVLCPGHLDTLEGGWFFRCVLLLLLLLFVSITDIINTSVPPLLSAHQRFCNIQHCCSGNQLFFFKGQSS